MYTIDENNTITIVKKDTAYFAILLDDYNLQDGDILTFTIAKEKESLHPLVQKELEFSDNLAVIFLSSTDTDLEKGTYYYDLQLTTRDGMVDTIMGGYPTTKLKIVQGVTY